MKFSEFATLVSRLKTLSDERERYVDSLPTDLDSIFDNAYSNCSGLMFDAMFDFVFCDELEMRQDVQYFLYEEYPQKIWVDDVPYVITNIPEYLAYAHENFQFDPE